MWYASPAHKDVDTYEGLGVWTGLAFQRFETETDGHSTLAKCSLIVIPERWRPT